MKTQTFQLNGTLTVVDDGAIPIPQGGGLVVAGAVDPVFDVPAPSDPTQAAIVAIARKNWPEFFLKGDRRQWYHEVVKDEAREYWGPKQPKGVLLTAMHDDEVLEVATRELWMARLSDGMKRIVFGAPHHRYQWVGNGTYERWANSILLKLRTAGLLAEYETPVENR